MNDKGKTDPKGKAKVTDRIVSWLRKAFKSSAPVAYLFVGESWNINSSSNAPALGVCFHGLSENSLVEGCTLFWTTGMHIPDLIGRRTMLFVEGEKLLRIVEVTISASRKEQWKKHFYNDPSRTEPWQFAGAYDRLLSSLQEAKGMKSIFLKNDHPLLNPTGIRKVIFRQAGDEPGHHER